MSEYESLGGEGGSPASSQPPTPSHTASWLRRQFSGGGSGSDLAIRLDVILDVMFIEGGANPVRELSKIQLIQVGSLLGRERTSGLTCWWTEDQSRRDVAR